MKRYRFERRGPLAIAAAAWGLEYDAAPPPPPAQQGAIAVVTIRGPLTHHSDWFCDSYDAIKERVMAALASPAAVVVLDIDSPGGDVSGCFETSLELRAMADAAGKPLYAYINGMGCSGAYALACAADRIEASAESLVGSIGVITMAVDMTEADRAMGVNVKIIASGKRKADGNPHQQITDDAVEALQSTVDDLAALFFALVSARRGLPREKVQELEAGVFYGPKALQAGLVDGVSSFSQFLSLVAWKQGGGGASEEDRVEYEEIVEALRALAEGEDEEKASKAKKALAALEGEGEEEKKDEAKAEGDGEEQKDEKPEASAQAAAADPFVALAAKVHSLEAKLAAKDEAEERKRLLASRPDFSKEVIAVLQKAPMKTLREAVETWPRVPAKTNPAAAAQANVKPTRGEGQNDGRAARLPPEEKAKLDAAMGLAKPAAAVRREGNAVVFGVMTREQARQAAQKEGAK